MIYDKAEYHLDSVRAFGLKEEQACVHIAFYVRWIAERELLSEAFEEDMEELLDAFREGKISALELASFACYSSLNSDMLNDEGNAFTETYYEDGLFYKDFATLSEELPSVYHTPFDDSNYQKLKLLMDKARVSWLAKVFNEQSQRTGAGNSQETDSKALGTPRPWWKFW